MKLVKVVILLVVMFISCLYSCSETSKKEITMQDLYFFLSSDGGDLKSGSRGGTPVKINPVTKTVTPVCVDPLCNHSVDCSLYSCETVCIAGDYLFYTVGYISTFAETEERLGTVKLCVYDMTDGNTRQLAEYGDSLMFAGGAENYLYYYVARYNETDNKSRIYYILYRGDAKSGKITEMPMYGEYSNESGGMGTRDYPNIYTVINGKIYWSAVENETMIFYTTDLNGKNKKALDFDDNKRVMNGIYDNGYAYYTDSYVTNDEFFKLSGNYEKWRALRDMKLYKISLDGGSGKLITEHIIAFMPCGDKIYYTVMQDTPELIEYNGEKTWNWSGGKVYVINSDGTDNRLLCETGYDLDGFSGFIDAKTVDGIDYIVLSFYDIVENPFYESGYEYNRSPNALLINGSTGEYTELKSLK